MITRSQWQCANPDSHNNPSRWSLPLQRPVVWITRQDWFYAWQHDYFCCLFHEDEMESPTIHTWKKKHDNQLLPLIHENESTTKHDHFVELYKQDCVYNVFGCAPHRVKNMLEITTKKKCQRLFFVPFINSRAHVRGRVDALYHRDLFGETIPASMKGTYVMVVYSPWTKVQPHHFTYFYSQILLRFAFVDMSLIDRSYVAVCFYHTYPDETERLRHVQWIPVDPLYQQTLRYHAYWIRRAKQCRKAFAEWGASVLHPMLFPNMKALSPSTVMTSRKQRAAQDIGDITLLWGCTVRHRERLWKQYRRSSFFDTQVNATLLGFSPFSLRHTIVDAMIHLHRQPCETWYHIHSSETLKEWQEFRTSKPSFTIAYVDFEWLDHLYLIGTYCEGVYRAFWATTMSPDDVRTLMTTFETWARDKYLVFWHAEKSRYAYEYRHLALSPKDSLLSSHQWIDLCDIIRHTMVFQGLFGFSLKGITKTLQTAGCLPADAGYDTLVCDNGQVSMSYAQTLYSTTTTNSLKLRDILESYNRMDCQVLYHIDEWLCHLVL